MKRNFELLHYSSRLDHSLKEAGASGTTSGAAQGHAWQDKLAALMDLADKLGLRLHDSQAFEAVDKNAFVLIAGSPSAQQLEAVSRALLGQGNDVGIVVDALCDLTLLLDVLSLLNEKSVQMLTSGGVKRLVTCDHHMIYAYPKADCTASIAVFADLTADDPLVLTMVRGSSPYKGKESFPGGFLNVQLENIFECAARELMEECFVDENGCFTYEVKPQDLVLIDVRSNPERDERGHVVDHGFAWYIQGDESKVMNALQAGDDAEKGSARFVRLSQLLERELAFDHKQLLLAAMEKLKSEIPSD